MTPFILLIVCVAAQIVIAVGLGIYLLRRHLREQREKKQIPPPKDHPPG
jgi:hypothetical protein